LWNLRAGWLMTRWRKWNSREMDYWKQSSLHTVAVNWWRWGLCASGCCQRVDQSSQRRHIVAGFHRQTCDTGTSESVWFFAVIGVLKLMSTYLMFYLLNCKLPCSVTFWYIFYFLLNITCFYL